MYLVKQALDCLICWSDIACLIAICPLPTCPLNDTEQVSQPSLTTRDRELVSVLEVRIEPGDLNPRPLTLQSVTLPTLPRAGFLYSKY